MKDAYYFSHDTNSFMDPKIRLVISEYGLISYALFWVILEMLASQRDYKIRKEGFIKSILPLLQGKTLMYDTEAGIGFYKDDNGNEVQPHDAAYHCIDLGHANSIFSLMMEVELFNHDDVFFWSDSLTRRMKIKEEKSNKQRENANKRWHNDAIAMPASMPLTMPRNALK